MSCLGLTLRLEAMRFFAAYSLIIGMIALVACAPASDVSRAPLPPATTPAPNAQKAMLGLVNQARSQARYCAQEYFEAAPALSYNSLLSEAALSHARDMSKQGFFSHTGSDGSDPASRLSKLGYRWARVAENLAYGSAGAYTEEAIVQGWLASPGHCKNIMNPVFRELGMASLRTNYDYWVHVFALPQ